MTQPLVSILILNYNGKKFLPSLFESLSKIDYKNFEILLLDNNSTDGSLSMLSTKFLKQLHLDKKANIFISKKNTGFAKGNNILVSKAKGKYLLFLNSDVFLDHDALDKLVSALEKDKYIAGVAPKTYLSRYLPMKIFDSIGICMDFNGSPYNRGIGQLDLGQYDVADDVMGICFACALVRADIYRSNGGLDDSYFAYFEDIDWCFRTKKEGYKFATCPSAIANHYHSGTSSEQSYAWKYYLIFRNYLRTVVKSFEIKNVIKVSLKKTLDLVRTMFSRNSSLLLKLSMLKVVLNFIFIDWYIYLFRRRQARKDFIPNIKDCEIFAYSIGEPSNFFNPQTYEPEFNLEFLKFVKSKLKLLGNKQDVLNRISTIEKNYYCVSNKTQDQKIVELVS